jgi:flagellin-like protein
MHSRRGVTPVVATTLLIAIVIVLAGIVFVWAQGVVGEAVQKNDEPIERSCERVSLDTSIGQDTNGYFIDVHNNGNVPIAGFKLALDRDGTVDVLTVDASALNVGTSRRFALAGLYDSGVSSVEVVPVLRGTRGESLQDYVCGEQYGIAARVI